MLSRSLILSPSARKLLLRSFSTSTICYRDSARLCMAVQQPPWSLPTQKAPDPVLKVYNSLTRTKVGARSTRHHQAGKSSEARLS